MAHGRITRSRRSRGALPESALGEWAPRSEWRTQVPDSFDDDALRLANSRPASTSTIGRGRLLHHTTGYLSLAESTNRDASPEQQIVAQLLPSPYGTRSATEPGPCAGTRPFHVCGGYLGLVLLRGKGPRERLRDEQVPSFGLLAHDVKASPAHRVPADESAIIGPRWARHEPIPRPPVCSRSSPCCSADPAYRPVTLRVRVTREHCVRRRKASLDRRAVRSTLRTARPCRLQCRRRWR